MHYNQIIPFFDIDANKLIYEWLRLFSIKGWVRTVIICFSETSYIIQPITQRLSYSKSSL